MIDDDHQGPRFYWFDPNDIATDNDLAADTVPDSKDPIWEEWSAPLIALLKHMPQSMMDLKKTAGRRGSRLLVEECVYWLESRGHIISYWCSDGKKMWCLP